MSTIAVDGAKYLRLIYELDNELYGMSDSDELTFAENYISPVANPVYPWEGSSLEFDLNKTNGTATLTIMKDGKIVEKQFLRRVTDDNVFLKNLDYNESGEYVISVDDNEYQIASGLLHVSDLDIELVERHGVSYVFSVTVDGESVENEDVYVSLGNSTEKKKFYVSRGTLAVNAKLDQGLNIFHMELLGTKVPVEYINRQEGFLDIYLKYGLPGFAVW
jgi:hypothetical protein